MSEHFELQNWLGDFIDLNNFIFTNTIFERAIYNLHCAFCSIWFTHDNDLFCVVLFRKVLQVFYEACYSLVATCTAVYLPCHHTLSPGTDWQTGNSRITRPYPVHYNGTDKQLQLYPLYTDTIDHYCFGHLDIGNMGTWTYIENDKLQEAQLSVNGCCLPSGVRVTQSRTVTIR